jgi:hypothetical protein
MSLLSEMVRKDPVRSKIDFQTAAVMYYREAGEASCTSRAKRVICVGFSGFHDWVAADQVVGGAIAGEGEWNG